MSSVEAAALAAGSDAAEADVVDFAAGRVLAFDKPLGWTSFQLVGRVRWLLCRRLGVKKLKVGHAGTLDPLATGLMLVCTGKATKRIDELQAGRKEYVATLRLGATTPSFDLEHPIDALYPTAHITRELVDEALEGFRGELEQVPPTFSACKVDGKRAYDLARRGDEVELKAKRITIDELEVLSLRHVSAAETAAGVLTVAHKTVDVSANSGVTADDAGEYPELTLRVRCSKGTYIRSLARDIGLALGSGAHLTALRRTQVGDYSVDHAFASVDDFELWLNNCKLPSKAQ